MRSPLLCCQSYRRCHTRTPNALCLFLPPSPYVMWTKLPNFCRRKKSRHCATDTTIAPPGEVEVAARYFLLLNPVPKRPLTRRPHTPCRTMSCLTVTYICKMRLEGSGRARSSVTRTAPRLDPRPFRPVPGILLYATGERVAVIFRRKAPTNDRTPQAKRLNDVLLCGMVDR
jgi:hypothetical protein